jgi:transcriptional regulator with XRE-family HTH domain
VIVLDRRHLAASFRQMRINRKLTQRQLAERLHVTSKAVGYREGRALLDVDVVLETAAVFGYDLALIPKRHPDARPTGTGWPA